MRRIGENKGKASGDPAEAYRQFPFVVDPKALLIGWLMGQLPRWNGTPIKVGL